MTPDPAVAALRSPDTDAWYRNAWPWLLMLGPGLVIVAGVATAWLAVTSSDGLVADDHYRRGLEINRTLERTAAAQSLGMRAVLDVAPDGRVELKLASNVTTAETAPPSIVLTLAHPTRAAGDLRATLVRGGDAFYRGSLGPVSGGRWRASAESKAWRLRSGDIDVPIVDVALTPQGAN